MEEHPQARSIVETLHKAGFVAYYAGGWVRDYLLQLPSDDIDIATNAPPETVQALFSHTVPIGIAFGIVLVIIDDHQYEVATFRQDFDYQDGRRPARIAFSTALEDAKRRDFTINGMFYDPIREEVLDYVEGRADLHAKLIRAIGNPHDRIKEDRLRMIRAIRLACRFGFHIEESTAEAIRSHAKELFPAVAIERVVQELSKGQLSGILYPMLLNLHKFGLLTSIFPHTANLSLETLEKQLAPLKQYPRKAPLIAFLLPLFSKEDPSLELQLCKTLKLSNLDLQFTLFLQKAREITSAEDTHSRTIENLEWVSLYANALWPLSFEILIAHLNPEKQPIFRKEHELRVERLREAIERMKQHNPVIKACDLQKAGIEAGKTMGLLLKEAERISCNEGIFESAPLLKRLRQSDFWP